MDFAISLDHRVKMTEREKIDKYLDLAGELKKLWNMVTGIPIVVDALGMDPKGPRKEIPWDLK